MPQRSVRNNFATLARHGTFKPSAPYSAEQVYCVAFVSSTKPVNMV